MAEPDLLPRARGDESELYREFNPALMRLVARSLYGVSAETVEDACSFAWAQFLQHQPARDRNWRSWLITTAQREAWLIERNARAQRPDPLIEELAENGQIVPLSLEEQQEIRDDVSEALSIISELPLRLQRIALLRALGVRHAEIGQLTGDSPTRVAALVEKANARIYEIVAERGHVPKTQAPRALRLKELEADPPEWLVNVIGRPVRRSRKLGGRAVRQRAWRRAAIALDDYRIATGLDGLDTVMRHQPEHPALRKLHAVATRAVEAHRDARLHERGAARER
jgi:hypothetical protein